MPLSTVELAEARQAASDLLEQAGLEAYLFEIEPRQGHWELRVECAIPQGWQTLALPVDKDLLLASRKDAAVRHQLLEDWRRHFGTCKKASPDKKQT
jgi:hypothetical protein